MMCGQYNELLTISHSDKNCKWQSTEARTGFISKPNNMGRRNLRNNNGSELTAFGNDNNLSVLTARCRKQTTRKSVNKLTNAWSK